MSTSEKAALVVALHAWRRHLLARGYIRVFSREMDELYQRHAEATR